MKRLSSVLMICAALLLAGCSDGEDRTVGCTEAEAWLKALVAMEDFDSSTLESMAATLDPINEAEAAMAKAAPDDVREALAVIEDTDPESLKQADQKAVADAEQVRDNWISEDCDLALPN